MANKPKNPANVAVVVQPGYVLLDVAVPQQVFGRWPDYVSACLPTRAPYQTTLVSAIPAESPLVPRGVEPLDHLETADTIIVAGVRDPTEPPDPELVERLQDAYNRGSRMVSICTGAFALAAAGILDGRNATTHWYWARLLRDRHPLVTVREAELYVEDTGVFTSAGVLAGTDLCLHLLRLDHGQAAANTVARFLVSPPHRDGGQAQFIGDIPPGGRSEITDSIRWVLEHLHEPLTLEMVSRHSNMSTRTLSRRFLAVTGTSVMNWVTMQRVARARELLETTRLGVDDIAHQCGFGSAQSLRLHFTSMTRTSPARYRRTFGG